MTTKIAAMSLGAMTAIFAMPETAHAVAYQISEPGSTYEYLVPPEGPDIPGCQPDDFHCAFAIAGTLVFEVDLVAGNGAYL